MNIVGIIDDSDSFEAIVILYKVFKNFYKTKIVTSYKTFLKKTSYNNLNNYLLQMQNNNTDITIIRLHSSDLDSQDIQNIKFNIIVLLSMDRIFDLVLPYTEYFIYNYDLFSKYEFIKKYDLLKFSFGFSYNADVFPSSLQDDFSASKIMICINKNLVTLSNNNIVTQEFLLKTNNSEESKIYNILASLIVLILFDLKIPDISQSLDFLFKEENIHA